MVFQKIEDKRRRAQEKECGRWLTNSKQQLKYARRLGHCHMAAGKGNGIIGGHVIL
jgi:hypothetical protein